MGNRKKSNIELSKQIKQGTVLVLFLAYILYITFSSHGLITWSELDTESENADLKITRLQKQIDSLRTELTQIKTSDRHIEAIAREKYHMIKPDETVYIIPEKK